MARKNLIRVDITESFDDPESIKISNKIFQIGGTLKKEKVK